MKTNLSCLHKPENPTDKFGQALRNQIEERLAYFENGAPTEKNMDVMKRVIESLEALDDEEEVQEEVPGTFLCIL